MIPESSRSNSGTSNRRSNYKRDMCSNSSTCSNDRRRGRRSQLRGPGNNESWAWLKALHEASTLSDVTGLTMPAFTNGYDESGSYLGNSRGIKAMSSEVFVMSKPTSIVTNIATAAGVLFVGFLGYVVLSALPDLRRYIRISTM